MLNVVVMDEARGLAGLGLPWWVTVLRPIVVVLIGSGLGWAGLKAVAWFGERAMIRVQTKQWEVRAALAGDVRGAFAVFGGLGSLAASGVAITSAPTLGLPGKVAVVTGSYFCFSALRSSLQDDWERRILGRPRAEPGTSVGWAAVLAAYAVIVAYVAAMPERYDWKGWLWAGYGCLLLLLLRSALASRAYKRLFLRAPRAVAVAAVAQASKAVGIKAPSVFELPSPHVNAAAFSGLRAVAFTDAAVDLLVQGELELVARHELGHLSEGSGTELVRALFAVRAWLLVGFFPTALPTSTALTCGCVCWYLAKAVERWVTRRLELRADRHAVVAGFEGAAFARLLERMHRLNLTTGATPSTHPQLDERTRGLGVAVQRRRREPPQGRAHVRGALVIAATLLLALALGSLGVRELAAVPAASDRAAIERMLVLRGDAAGVILAGSLWAESGDRVRAQQALDQMATSDAEPEAALLRAGLRARGGDCHGARTALASVAYCDTEAECSGRLRAICARHGSSACLEVARRELRVVVHACGEPNLFDLD